MHEPTSLCPTFSLHNPGSAFSTLETVSETLVRCLPGADLPEINHFLVSPALICLPLDFVSSEWWNLVSLGALEPAALALLLPGFQRTGLGQPLRGVLM